MSAPATYCLALSGRHPRLFAMIWGRCRKPTADRYGCRKGGIPPPVCGQLFFNSSASITRMPLGPRT